MYTQWWLDIEKETLKNYKLKINKKGDKNRLVVQKYIGITIFKRKYKRNECKKSG